MLTLGEVAGQLPPCQILNPLFYLRHESVRLTVVLWRKVIKSDPWHTAWMLGLKALLLQPKKNPFSCSWTCTHMYMFYYLCAQIFRGQNCQILCNIWLVIHVIFSSPIVVLCSSGEFHSHISGVDICSGLTIDTNSLNITAGHEQVCVRLLQEHTSVNVSVKFTNHS